MQMSRWGRNREGYADITAGVAIGPFLFFLCALKQAL